MECEADFAMTVSGDNDIRSEPDPIITDINAERKYNVKLTGESQEPD